MLQDTRPVFIAPLDRLEADLRAAVRALDYEKTLSLLPVYASEVAQTVPALSGNQQEQEQVVNRAVSLLRWAKTVVLAGRAHDQAQLSQADHAARYAPAADRRQQNWHYEA